MLVRIIGCLAVLGCLITSVSAAPIEVLTNGGFETGTFAGWTASSNQTSPFIAALSSGNSQVVNSTFGQPAWFLRNQPANYFGVPNVATPITNFGAFNGFDGFPGQFTLQQAFAVTGPLSSADLSFDYAVQSSYSGQNRVFTVNILNGAGTSTLATVFTLVQPTGNNIAWNPANVDLDLLTTLNGLGVGNYQLQFLIDIPQNYTGPAQFAIDNISLQLDTVVPEPASMLAWGVIAGVGAVGYRLRKKKTPVA